MELETTQGLGWKYIIPPAGTITKTPSENYIITNGVGGGGSGPTTPRPPKPTPPDNPKDYGEPHTPGIPGL